MSSIPPVNPANPPTGSSVNPPSRVSRYGWDTYRSYSWLYPPDAIVGYWCVSGIVSCQANQLPGACPTKLATWPLKPGPSCPKCSALWSSNKSPDMLGHQGWPLSGPAMTHASWNMWLIKVIWNIMTHHETSNMCIHGAALMYHIMKKPAYTSIIKSHQSYSVIKPSFI